MLVKGLDDGPDGLNDAAFDRALRGPTSANDAACAKGAIRHTDGDALLGGSVCAGCGCRFGGHGLRAVNNHHRAARKRLAKAVRP